MKSSTEKAASWFQAARKAQDGMISGCAKKELGIISDVFERFAKLWDGEREKLRGD